MKNNHIHNLQIEIARLTAEKIAYEDGLQDLKIYLNSSKFFTNTTVQCADVIMRLQEIRSFSLARGDDAALGKKIEIESNLTKK